MIVCVLSEDSSHGHDRFEYNEIYQKNDCSAYHFFSLEKMKIIAKQAMPYTYSQQS